MKYGTHISAVCFSGVLIGLMGCAADTHKEQTSAAVTGDVSSAVNTALLTAHWDAIDHTFEAYSGSALNKKHNLKDPYIGPLPGVLNKRTLIVTA